MTSVEKDWRKIMEHEKRILDLLLAQKFPGKDELRKQIDGAQVRTIDQEASIEIRPHSSIKAPVVKRIPVEAYAPDSDGVMVHALLHVVDGLAVELEFYKDDSSRILAMPDKWQTMVLLPS
jgi:hypothetical protein